MTDAGWLDWLGRTTIASVCLLLYLSEVSLSAPWQTADPASSTAPASHPSTMEKQGRVDCVFCLQPTSQGRVASIGFGQAWQQRQQHQRALWTPHMMD